LRVPAHPGAVCRGGAQRTLLPAGTAPRRGGPQ
jgi:hypothetical protein